MAGGLNLLRRRAEALVRKSHRIRSAIFDDRRLELLYELEVHQTELEMQNQELLSIQHKIEVSRDRFAALYDFAPVGYLTLDAGGAILEANLTAATMLGVDRRALLGKKFSGFIAPGSQDAFYLHRHSVLTKSPRQTCELDLRRPGGIGWKAQLESIAVQDVESGQPQCWTALSDITGRTQAEEKLGHLAAIVDSSNDAIIGRNLDDLIISWNPASERMFGYSAKEILGRSFSVLVPSDRAGELRYLRDRILRGERIGNQKTAWLAKDGRRLDVSCATSPLLGPRGNVLGISAVVRDITRQRWAEAVVCRSEQALADFFDASPLGLLWVGADGRILRVNRAQLALVGCSGTDIFGRPLTDFFADPATAQDLLDRLRHRESLTDRLVRLRRKDGSAVHVLINANGLWEAEKLVHSRWFIRDVTRRVELEKEILLTGERVQRRIGQELHDDLCQQLTSIEYLVRSVERQLIAKSPAQSARVREIGQLIRRANTRARDLAHGLAPTDIEPDGLAEALKNLAARTKKVAAVDCRFRSAVGVAVDDPVARIYLYRIAQEAVNNAMRRGKARRIDIALAPRGNHLVLSVKDNGIGLSPNFRAEKGLGLRIMDYRAGALGGSVTVRRRPTGGTIVLCWIPFPAARRTK